MKKLALPITRRNITRPATETSTACDSRSSFVGIAELRLQIGGVRRAAKIVRERFSGRAQRRQLFAAMPDDVVFFGHYSPAFRLASMNSSRSPSSTSFGSRAFDAGAQILDARLIEHVRTDLAAPTDVGFVVFDGLLRRFSLLHFQFVQFRAQLLPRLVAVLMLRSFALALHDGIRRQVRHTNRRVGFVHVLAAGAARAIRVDAHVGRIDLDFDLFVDFRRHEHRCERRMAAIAGIERRFAHESMHAGFGAQPAVGIFAGRPRPSRL